MSSSCSGDSEHWVWKASPRYDPRSSQGVFTGWLERKHVQSLCVNREEGTEKKAGLKGSHMLSKSEVLSGCPGLGQLMGRDVPAPGHQLHLHMMLRWQARCPAVESHQALAPAHE